jgi:hypothetical protein
MISGGINVAFGGHEHVLTDKYDILYVSASLQTTRFNLDDP